MKYGLLLVSILCGCLHPLAAAPSSSAPTPAPAPVAPVASFNVRNFGATGDGQTKDTTALQKALDACAAAGGGMVVVPSGVYLTGSIVLGANTALKLETLASLVGSPDIADYPLLPAGYHQNIFRAL